MATKVALPNIATFSTEGLPFGAVIFLQAVQDGMRTIDANVIYKDVVDIEPVRSRIRAKSAQGNAFTVSGTSLASGDDFIALVRDFETLLASHQDLIASYNNLVQQLRGQ